MMQLSESLSKDRESRGKVQAVRVLYSFPHKLGANRICFTAWQQVKEVANAGADVLCFPGVLARAVPSSVKVKPTLARGKIRISYKLLGKLRALALHDRIVARRIPGLVGKIDIIHTWPDAALETLKVARRLGIPTVLERPNAYTRYAYSVVQDEASRLGIELPPDNEYWPNEAILRREEAEYQLADRLLCPSEFVARTFMDAGFQRERLALHRYGYDASLCYNDPQPRKTDGPITMLFAGDCAVRKGLHFALEAWLAAPAHRDGLFLIAGRFLPEYEAVLRPMLAHPSVKVLGYRSDVPELMRRSDIFVLPSIEEGSALVTYEARGNGCVLLVSDAAGAVCQHMTNGLIHPAGDVRTLTDHLALLHRDRALLGRLRTSSVETAGELTWAAAGRRLLEIYRDIVGQ